MIIEENSIQLKEKANKAAKDACIASLREGRTVYLNASGASMAPFIKSYDTLTITSAIDNHINVGDIVAVENELQEKRWFYVHRVVRIDVLNGEKIYLTKGDGQGERADRPVKFDKIAGKVIGIERDGVKMDLERPIWKYLNSKTAHLSLNHPGRLRSFSLYINLAIEWQCFPSKIIRKIAGNNIMRNTERLILICARPEINKDRLKMAEAAIRRGVDWDFFAKFAKSGWLSYMFYNSLRELDHRLIIPAHILDELKMNYAGSLGIITGHYHETIRLLALFSNKGIKIAPFKGPILSKRLYNDIAARGRSVDIDLFADVKNKKAVTDIFKEAGYDLHLDLKEESVFVKKGSILTELHWINFPEDTELREEEGVNYHDLKAEDLLLQLAEHSIQNLAHLRYACDMNGVLSRYGDALDWDMIVDKAKERRLVNSLYALLTFCRLLFDSPIPPHVFTMLRPNLLKRAMIRMFVNKKMVLSEDSSRRRFMKKTLWFQFHRLLEARSAKEYLAIFFPPKEYLAGRTYTGRFMQLIKDFKESF